MRLISFYHYQFFDIDFFCACYFLFLWKCLMFSWLYQQYLAVHCGQRWEPTRFLCLCFLSSLNTGTVVSLINSAFWGERDGLMCLLILWISCFQRTLNFYCLLLLFTIKPSGGCDPPGLLPPSRSDAFPRLPRLVPQTFQPLHFPVPKIRPVLSISTLR